jgi:hypothetical protein
MYADGLFDEFQLSIDVRDFYVYAQKVPERSVENIADKRFLGEGSKKSQEGTLNDGSSIKWANRVITANLVLLCWS